MGAKRGSRSRSPSETGEATGASAATEATTILGVAIKPGKPQFFRFELHSDGTIRRRWFPPIISIAGDIIQRDHDISAFRTWAERCNLEVTYAADDGTAPTAKGNSAGEQGEARRHDTGGAKRSRRRKA